MFEVNLENPVTNADYLHVLRKARRMVRMIEAEQTRNPKTWAYLEEARKGWWNVAESARQVLVERVAAARPAGVN